ncbi:uncharacterized protein MCYG_01249 [Microsporum canis CBS 113480]|uniref:Uncharacterized protein n=1 Tax=Arthroderma otae (strain ATCC MYA-4605 / CBS 113480) TaxID=554155 RepID=C5FEN7_ARTOC|nr:uncharacterized protein MCYG_01249 [Microsporum canis CBS 113480]EEQ28361.1 predicted protein [Microsporum canis CBS 113480]
MSVSEVIGKSQRMIALGNPIFIGMEAPPSDDRFTHLDLLLGTIKIALSTFLLLFFKDLACTERWSLRDGTFYRDCYYIGGNHCLIIGVSDYCVHHGGKSRSIYAFSMYTDEGKAQNMLG